MTLREWVNNAVVELTRAGVESPRVDAALILCHILNCDRTHLLAHPSASLDPSELARADDLMGRRLRREPLPHLLGEWEFMGHRYEVGPQALIPRPETELLVEAVVERLGVRGANYHGSCLDRGLTPQPPSLRGKGEPDNADGCDIGLPSPGGSGAGGEARETLQILEVGTGTGCIAIEVALRLPTARVTSIDVSTEALELAGRNVARFQVQDRVALRHARFPDDVNDVGAFDAIVSNAPYIPSGEVDRLEPELTRYEPRAALDGGPDGLDVIRSLISESGRFLKPGGLLAMEIGHDHSETVFELLGKSRWSVIEGVQDLAGHLRVVLAR